MDLAMNNIIWYMAEFSKQMTNTSLSISKRLMIVVV